MSDMGMGEIASALEAMASLAAMQTIGQVGVMLKEVLAVPTDADWERHDEVLTTISNYLGQMTKQDTDAAIVLMLGLVRAIAESVSDRFGKQGDDLIDSILRPLVEHA